QPPAPTGSISGKGFGDADANGKKNSGEGFHANVKVYLDANKNGAFDSGESSIVTNSWGVFTFANLAAGTHRMREVVPTNYRLIAPAAGYSDVTLAVGAKL